MFTVTVVDETTAGTRGDAWHLDIFEETLTLRELIRRRVFQEVAEYNAKPDPVFQGLVRPDDAEVTLNGYRLRSKRQVDPEKQVASALAAGRCRRRRWPSCGAPRTATGTAAAT